MIMQSNSLAILKKCIPQIQKGEYLLKGKRLLKVEEMYLQLRNCSQALAK